MTMNLNGVHFNGDRSMLMFSVGGKVFGYDTTNGEEVYKFASDDPIERFTISPDESLMAVMYRVPGAEPGERGTHLLQIREFETKELLHEALVPDFAYHFRFANDNRTLALCCNEWKPARSLSSVVLFDAQTGQFGAEIPTGRYQIHQLAFSPDDQRIATSHSHTQILIWNLADFPAP